MKEPEDELPENLPRAPEQEPVETVSDDKFGQILQRLPEQERETILHYVQKTHVGPICTPDDLERYDEILPGAAERIVRLPEREQEHRHGIVKLAIERDFTLKSRGQIYALLAMVMLLAFCVFIALAGDITAAAEVAKWTIVGTVGVFVGGKAVEAVINKEKSDKD